jgi:hypothetical protein
VSEFVSLAPTRRNRRFFSFHRPQRCRGCGAVLSKGFSECDISRTRDAHRVRNRFSHACPQCLGFSEFAAEDDAQEVQ